MHIFTEYVYEPAYTRSLNLTIPANLKPKSKNILGILSEAQLGFLWGNQFKPYSKISQVHL